VRSIELLFRSWAKVVTPKDRKLLGGGVRRYRNAAGLTQEQLAEKVGINPVYFGQIERGYKVPTVDVLLRIAKALHVRLCDLVADV
jgi:transcriptional regulator with XRE-family HTH domain